MEKLHDTGITWAIFLYVLLTSISFASSLVKGSRAPTTQPVEYGKWGVQWYQEP